MNSGGATSGSSPSSTCLLFARALSSGDLERAAACFERQGCLITPDATTVHGRDRIRPLLAQLITRGVEIGVDLSTSIGTGDTALVRERWTIRSSGAGGARVAQTVHPTLVLRRVEKVWRLAIVAPWGRGGEHR